MPHKTRSLVWIKRALAIKNDRDAEHGFVLIVGFPDDSYVLDVSIRQAFANHALNDRLDFVHRYGLFHGE